MPLPLVRASSTASTRNVGGEGSCFTSVDSFQERVILPRCHGTYSVKNGRIHTGKPKWLCRTCGRQVVEDPQHRVIRADTKRLIDKLLLERLSLAAIARVAGVSERWLQSYVNEKYAAVPRQVTVRAKKRALNAGV